MRLSSVNALLAGRIVTLMDQPSHRITAPPSPNQNNSPHRAPSYACPSPDPIHYTTTPIPRLLRQHRPALRRISKRHYQLHPIRFSYGMDFGQLFGEFDASVEMIGAKLELLRVGVFSALAVESWRNGRERDVDAVAWCWDGLSEFVCGCAAGGWHLGRGGEVAGGGEGEGEGEEG